MKRILKIAAFCLSLALIVGIFAFANSLIGNPISKMLARRTAEKHLALNYPDTDYEIGEISYNFKDGCYYAHLVSPGSMDGNFTLRVSMGGKPVGDDYHWRVEGHRNVASRLSLEYREMVDTVLNSHAYPYTVSIGYGDLAFDREVGKEAVEGALESSELVNDKFYNVGALGARNGTLVLYIDSDTVTDKMAAEILLKTKDMMEQSGISFYWIDLILRHPPYDTEEPYLRPEGEIRLRNFRCEDIDEEGLMERIAKTKEDTQNYYKQDN